jgi:hypothetical protein
MLKWNVKKLAMLVVATALSVAFAKVAHPLNFTW